MTLTIPTNFLYSSLAAIEKINDFPIEVSHVLCVLLGSYKPPVACSIHDRKTPQEFVPCALRQSPSPGKHLIAEEVQPPLARQDDIIPRMKGHMQTFGEEHNGCGTCNLQLFFVMREEYEIIPVAHIATNFQIVLHEPVELMQVNVRENLACDVPYRYPDAPAVPGLPAECSAVIAPDDFGEQFDGMFILDPPSQEIEQNEVINVVEELLYISPPEPTVTEPMQKVLCALNRLVQSLLLAARPSIVQEDRIVYFVQIVIQQPMNETIFYRGHGNGSSFGITHREDVVRPVAICSTGKFNLQCEKMLLQSVAKLLHFRRVLLSRLEPEKTTPQCR